MLQNPGRRASCITRQSDEQDGIKRRGARGEKICNERNLDCRLLQHGREAVKPSVNPRWMFGVRLKAWGGSGLVGVAVLRCVLIIFVIRRFVCLTRPGSVRLGSASGLGWFSEIYGVCVCEAVGSLTDKIRIHSPPSRWWYPPQHSPTPHPSTPCQEFCRNERFAMTSGEGKYSGTLYPYIPFPCVYGSPRKQSVFEA